MRLPSVRNPRSLRDVLLITLAVVLWVVVIAWDLWAIRRILAWAIT